MTQRLALVASFFLCSIQLLLAQKPEATAPVARLGASGQARSGLACLNNAGAMNGVTLTPGSKSNDVKYLCLGDTLNVDHSGSFNLSSDPNPATQAGIIYAMYTCPPTVTGPELSNILADPCRETTPPPPGANSIWFVPGTSATNPDTRFINTGILQDNFNGGSPYQLFFAPATIDDFASSPKAYEGTPIGECVNVRVDQAFEVVYLNQIEVTNILVNQQINGLCAGSFRIVGGLPQFQPGVANYTVDMYLASNPAIKATLSGVFQNNRTITYTVPQAGQYIISITDGKSCDASVSLNVTCATIQFNMPNRVANPGDRICVDLTTANFNDVTGFELTLQFDPTVLSIVNPAADITLNAGMPTTLTSNIVGGNTIRLVWFNDLTTGVTRPDGSTLLTICFTVIGSAGSSSPLTILNGGEIILGAQDQNGDNLRGGYIQRNGRITVAGAGVIVTATTGDARCSDSKDGTLSVTGTSGTAPYTVEIINLNNQSERFSSVIPNPNNPASFNGLAPGSYIIRITDSGAPPTTDVDTVVIGSPPPISISIVAVNPVCPGNTNGECRVSYAGGTPPHTFLWNTGQTTPTITGLGDGPYLVTITDRNGCTATASATLAAPTMQIIPDITNVSCTGNGSDGRIDLFVSGGNGGFIYNWSTGGSSSSIINLAPGNFRVTITDSRGCSRTDNYNVTAPIPPSITGFDSVSVACIGVNSGQLTVRVTAGSNNNLSYQWINLSSAQTVGTTPTASNLGPGCYRIRVSAADGCQALDTVCLDAPKPLKITLPVANKPACPDQLGSVSFTVSGGSGNYTYRWSTGITSPTPLLPSITCDSTYRVTVTDDSQCNNRDSIAIRLDCPPAIQVAFVNITGVSCATGNVCDGSATAIGSGGGLNNGQYTFLWDSGTTNNGVGSSTANNLCPGFNVIRVTDGQCTIADSVFILTPDSVKSELVQIRQPSCFGLFDGEITVRGIGGTPGYTYLWNNGTLTPNAANLPVGTYQVTVSDSRGCTGTQIYDLLQPDLLDVQVDLDQTANLTCFDSKDGRLAVIATGGQVGTYQYTWSPAVTNNGSNATGLDPGTYYITVVDANGCKDSLNYSLTAPPPVFAVLEPVEPPVCNGEVTTVAVDTAWGGDGGPFRFSVDSGPRQVIGTSQQVYAGDHLVTVFDARGCTWTQNITITEPLPVRVEFSTGPVAEVDLGKSDTIDVLVYTDGTNVQSIEWSPTDVLTCLDPECRRVVVAPISESITYTVLVTDENGCVGEGTLLVDLDKNRNVFIPTIFSPNFDGKNDYFTPFVGPGVESVVNFQIYSRWGELLYSRQNFLPNNLDSTEGWDGTFKNKDLHQGVYVYIIEVSFIDGQRLTYRGDVTLIR